jgi:hypothetical protein
MPPSPHDETCIVPQSLIRFEERKQRFEEKEKTESVDIKIYL